MYSIVRAMAEEFRSKVEEKILQYPLDADVKDGMINLIMYTFANTMNIKSFFLDKLFNEVSAESAPVEGKPVKIEESIKDIIDTSIDYINILFRLNPFEEVQIKKLEHDIEEIVYSFIKEKVGKGDLTKDKYSEFIESLRKGYENKAIIKILKRRVKYNTEKRAELSSLLEYLTFSGRNYFEEDELENLQDALNFRLNKLKNYSFDYFVTNFFLQRSDIIPMSDKYDAVRFSYPKSMIKDLKNLLLSIDTEEKEEKDVQEDAKEIIHKQFSRIETLQKSINDLKKHK